jgi:hypothetical protein
LPFPHPPPGHSPHPPSSSVAVVVVAVVVAGKAVTVTVTMSDLDVVTLLVVTAALVGCVVGEVFVVEGRGVAGVEVVVGLGSSTTRVVTTMGVGELVEEEEVAGSGMVLTAVETAAAVLLDSSGEGLLML